MDSFLEWILENIGDDFDPADLPLLLDAIRAADYLRRHLDAILPVLGSEGVKAAIAAHREENQ